jgi:hypothetical protein
MNNKVNEIKEYWKYNGESNEIDCIVTLREIANSDIDDLIKIIKAQQEELAQWRNDYMTI